MFIFIRALISSTISRDLQGVADEWSGSLRMSIGLAVQIAITPAIKVDDGHIAL